MNCLDLIDKIAQQQLEIIKSNPRSVFIPTEDYGWENHRYTSNLFRLAHVEIFKQPKFGVVHCCVFPHESDPSPIYGFDVIAGESKITGVFLDLSPTEDKVEQFCNIQLGKERIKPEWGDIFSEHWLACRPDFTEMENIGNIAIKLLKKYLTELGKKGNQDKIVQAQNYYCSQQQKNPHTRKALRNIIGDHKTEEFMTKILFPKIEKIHK